MEAGAVEPVGADDAEGLARRAGLAILLFPLFEQGLWRVGAAGANELVAKSIWNMRVWEGADAALHLFPLVAGNHELLIRRGTSAEDHGADLNCARPRKRRRDEHVRRLAKARLRDRHRNRNRPLKLRRPCDNGKEPLVAPARSRHRAVCSKPLKRCRKMDFAALELLDQRFVETASVSEKRELRLRQNAPRIAEDIEKVIPQQRLAACKENVVDTICRALVQNRHPPCRVKLGLCERRIFVPYAIAVRTAEVALRRQFQRHVAWICHSQYQESQSAEFQIKLVSCLNLILTSLKGPDGNMHLHKAIRKTKLDRGKFYDKYIISLTTQCINNIAQGQLEYLLIPEYIDIFNATNNDTLLNLTKLEYEITSLDLTEEEKEIKKFIDEIMIENAKKSKKKEGFLSSIDYNTVLKVVCVVLPFLIFMITNSMKMMKNPEKKELDEHTKEMLEYIKERGKKSPNYKETTNNESTEKNKDKKEENNKAEGKEKKE